MTRAGQVAAQIAGKFVAVCAMGVFVVYVVVNVATGCGEPTYYADGTWATGECVGAPWVSPEKGTW